VDQSTDALSRESLQQFSQDGRLRYIHSDRAGLSRSRNLGIELAQAELIAITDDDCVVSPEWLSELFRVCSRYPSVGLVFGQVLPIPHDTTQGFVPDHLLKQDFWGRRPLDKMKIRGIGACMAVRKEAWKQIGGFDDLLGAGSLLRSCEDGDMTLRMLLAGWHVLETSAFSVTHSGFRTYREGRLLTKRDWYGIAAAYTKYIRAWNLSGIIILFYEFFGVALFQFLVHVVLWKRPFGLLRITSFVEGVFASLRLPVDRHFYKYKTSKEIEQGTN
jgi:GT2 family glycosyltransferase